MVELPGSHTWIATPRRSSDVEEPASFHLASSRAIYLEDGDEDIQTGEGVNQLIQEATSEETILADYVIQEATNEGPEEDGEEPSQAVVPILDWCLPVSQTPLSAYA